MDDGLTEQQGLYDPAHEHDSCGVGFVVDVKGRKSHAIVRKALQVLMNLLHTAILGAFALRYLSIAEEVPDAPVRAAPSRSRSSGAKRRR